MSIKNLLPKFPNLKYVSIGDGDERKNLERLRKELERLFLVLTKDQGFLFTEVIKKFMLK